MTDDQWAERRAEELLPCNCGTDGDKDWDPHLEGCQAEIRPAVAAELGRLAEQVEQARAERDGWSTLARLLDKLLACYRIGKQPGGLLDEIREARAGLDEEASDGKP